ncbi:adenylyl-sulfate kinase [Candidatus Uabimicrobium amorphum]|uniref:Adenylyl-sulfate kinase n=1 Tax=Uabimicrobium amorphum TaxID=2596890 RepID=A0A5S9F4L7_UABAM|nr:adenylyl-sulfate kinase [Candidatus Uabimicrobium amorphum]BBM84729.1 adenylyl-sulfate kinase [Candidatus Uabimicrobium amorphum]
MEPRNIYWHHGIINRTHREQLNKHRGCCLWFTGLSGSGKSTTACKLEEELHNNGIHCYLLDGDNIRHGLNNDLGFSPQDRKENIRRIGETAKLFVDAGIVVITSFISPYISDRQAVRQLFGTSDFIELYVSCSLQVCEQRDPKGLYQKARKGEISSFTGISAPYEAPESPEITVHTDKHTTQENVTQILNYLQKNNYLHLQ